MDQLSEEERRRKSKEGQVENDPHAEALAKSQAETAEARSQYNDLFDNAPTIYFNFSEDGTILALNFAAAKLAGGDRDGLVNTNLKPLLSALDRTRFEEYLKRIFGGGSAESFEVAIAKEGVEAVQIVIESVLSADGKVARASVFDVTERNKSDEERKQLVAELQVAMGKLKLLSGMLPICLACKKIRDNDGQWTEVEVYITKYSEATFSQGLCPDCFPEFLQ